MSILYEIEMDLMGIIGYIIMNNFLSKGVFIWEEKKRMMMVNM